MFKFITLSVLSVVGAGYLLGTLISSLALGFYGAFAIITVASIVMAVAFVIPTMKTVLTGLALNGLTGGASGGYNKVS